MKKESDLRNTIFMGLCKEEGLYFVSEYKFHPDRKWRFDYANEGEKIAIEVEGGGWVGGRHTSPQGFTNDCEKYNTATIMGWRILRFPAHNLLRKETIDMIKELYEGIAASPSIKA